MSVALYRIDDRLIHGQVVVGWGQPLNIGFIVLVDDNVACCDWEQDLYRMGVPPEMELFFADVPSAIRDHHKYLTDPRRGIVVTPDIETMQRLVQGAGTIHDVNVGGIHHRVGRTPRLRYVFLTPDEEQQLAALAEGGVKVSAQDVPNARQVGLQELLTSRAPEERTA
ncbi:MAG TPA: PTS sugar transporter subunit IIB [Gemmatimonadaceae bacterium]|nr:PTS sugar transporter subunit IIB [Gemmatimonadaceae bacterium]